jgi:hypothetical protein
MPENIGQLIVMASGAILILFGMLPVTIQFFRTRNDRMSRSASISKRGLEVKTSYVGLIIIALGAALEVLGYLS